MDTWPNPSVDKNIFIININGLRYFLPEDLKYYRLEVRKWPAQPSLSNGR